MMSTIDTPPFDLIAQDFRARMQGKLEDDKIEAAVASLTSVTPSYPARGEVASMFLIMQFKVSVTNGKTFNGRAGGLSWPGAGVMEGDVYSDDIYKMYRETKSFEFNASPVWTSLLFFDGNTNLLGNFQAAAVSSVAGIGGGAGEWS
jgi:hypothetical protein